MGCVLGRYNEERDTVDRYNEGPGLGCSVGHGAGPVQWGTGLGC
jgi:hypothetical protein